MKAPTRTQKEQRIIDAAEKVFETVGFKNARMEDIAKEAEITKVTLYTYFQSKENLYMAITFRALSSLVEVYEKTIQQSHDRPGIDSVIAVLECFMDFCEENYLYSEALLEYFALVRSTLALKDDTKLTEAMKESHYFSLLEELHNLPFKMTVKEIQRGMADGSINAKIDPMFATLHGWTMVVGYVKVISASGANATPLFNVKLKDLKKFNLDLTRRILSAQNI